MDKDAQNVEVLKWPWVCLVVTMQPLSPTNAALLVSSPAEEENIRTHILYTYAGGASGKGPTCWCRRLERHGFGLGGGHGNSLQFSCLENPIDRAAWWATVHGVTKSWTRLKQLSMHTCTYCTLLFTFFFSFFCSEKFKENNHRGKKNFRFRTPLQIDFLKCPKT